MKIIGVIGGKGVMGRFFVRIFKEQGHRVLVSDVGTRLSNKDLTKRADVVIVAVPIHLTRKVIREITPYTRASQLLTDVTSLKSFPVQEMRKSKASVIGMHPLFRPGPHRFKGQTIVLTPVRASKVQTAWLQKIFLGQGATVKIMTPEKHDKLMAIIQVLVHFHSLVLGHSLQALKVDITELMEVMSPIYRLQFDVVCRIFAQDPRLYASIAMENTETEKITKSFLQVTHKLRKIIGAKKVKNFLQEFEKTRQFLGPFSKQALRESDLLLGTFSGLVDKKIKKT